MSTRFNNLPPKPEYIVAAKAVLEQGGELSIQEISRETGLSQTQSLSALDYLLKLGEIEVRRPTKACTSGRSGPFLNHQLVQEHPDMLDTGPDGGRGSMWR